MKPKLTVELRYFRRSGKYYTSGEFETDDKPPYQIFEEVKQLRQRGHLPGLSPSNHLTEFIVLINVPKHEYAHPHLLT